MAEEQRAFCKYCNSDHTVLSYGLHQLSKPHVKKVKMELLQCDFSCVCRVCTIALRDLQDVENHVQDQPHKEKLDSRLLMSYNTSKCTCELCGVLFHNELALEAHRLMPSHRNVANTYSFPKLNELLRQLSGLHGENLALDMSSLCSICNVQHDGLDAYIMHLFTTTHISQLRFSSCFVCKKEFIHAENRESHLGSSKHSSNLQKYSNILEEGPRFSTLITGGYPCMFCMVRCSSWLCLELHLQYTFHSDAVRRSKAKHPVSAKINFAIPRDDVDDQVNACDIYAAKRWREWRQNVSKEHAWCHRCGVSLPTLDVANTHSEKHDLGKDQLVMHKTHAHGASDSSPAPLLFDCCVCALSFKGALLLAAHEASFQHHYRWAKSSILDDLTSCASCGVLVSQKDDDKVDACKELDVSHRHVSGTGHETEGLCNNPAKTKNHVCMFDPCCVKKERSPMECRNDGAVFFTNGNGGKVEKDSGMMLLQIEKCSKEEKNSSQIRVPHVNAVPKRSGGALPLECAGHVENDVRQDSRIPVIAAAALAPLGAFHQSLHSIMTIVVEALSATLPVYMQHAASSSQENMKRERQKDQAITEGQHEAKKFCSEETMKETLHHILQSVRSNSASVAMDVKSMDKAETVLAVAASLVPKFSPGSCGSAGVQGEAETIQGQNEACTKSIDIKLCVEQGLEGNQCDSEKLHVDHILQPVLERATQAFLHGNNIGQDTVKESTKSCLNKVNELPALTMEVGTPSTCVKAEKDDDHDGDGSFSIPSQFKDADLWWVLSDSEDFH